MSASQAQWKLVWADEFDKNGPPDPAVWQAENGFTRNHEAQWFQPQNAYCKNGFLILEAKKERVKNPKYVADSKDWKENREFAEYTSASIITRNKKSFKYGRFEMKAKIDTRSGLWPAFWTLGEKGEWPDNGEIDIMEFYRGMLLANLAWGSSERYKPVWNSVKLPVKEFNDPEWSQKFHVWRMDWDENFIRLYVDDKLINEQDLDKATNSKQTAMHPFRHPHYILLTLALGGDNGGDLTSTTFPAKFEIDYVRVYQKE
ncbi:family 16 glycosylhydrolase [Dyadobacter sp. CY326]|uniref:glycoside hydrolase family 16 protein n=1 Tax=Dyadobacter sp. CY326 TaxID=2907300 RepID=UPI001F44BC16|nr:glycoside hydrolase family 16 protein [Dyadobacter sp. CY326]MCE7065431.1 glycoside hydrolase family 16 protein [Dyadobacter sp. CY326]